MKPLFAVDFEYNQPNNPDMGLISVDFCTEGGRQQGIWLKDSAEGKDRAVRILTRVMHTHTLVAHNVVAEASCLIALGLNPRDFEWFDTYLEYRQLQNSNVTYMYGWHFRESLFGGGWAQSYPLLKPSDLLELDDTFGEDREKYMARAKADGRNHEQVTPSLLHALRNILGVEVSVGQKTNMRALILERRSCYTEAEREQILAYGASDTKHLIPLAMELKQLVWDRLRKVKAIDEDRADGIILWRARAAANTAVYTMTGIPISRERWTNLISQKDTVIRASIQEFQAQHFNLWEYDPREDKYKMKKSLCNEWVDAIRAKHHMPWPKTATGDYSMSTADGQPLESYRDLVPEILDYCHLQELIKGLGSHATEEEAVVRKAAGKKVFSDFLGDDDRVRPWYGSYGTQTARNAPGAVGFIFAQAGWLRGLIEPKPGRVIGERDFSSQEAYIAAVLSNDPALRKAYASGDPYLAFAVSAGAAPKDATKTSHGEIRNLFKSTVLGLQYGMGALKLSIKLTADTGRPVSIEKAKELIALHKEVYYVYYTWKERVWERYRLDGKPITLSDGWYLDLHSTSKLSTLNFPVQGGGSAVMRHMIDLLLGKGVMVLCPVHDSIVYECAAEDEPHISHRVGEAMLEACEKVVGEAGMRVGKADLLHPGEYWGTEKNAKSLAKNRKYMEFKPELEKMESYLDLFLK